MRIDRPESDSETRDDARTEQLARDLYERVRQLNHATSGPPDLTQPSTVYTLLGNLGAAAHGLDQTLDQLNAFLLHEEAADRLGHDRGESTAVVVSECEQALTAARHHTRGLNTALGEAQSAINAIHGSSPEQEARQLGSPVETAAEDFPAQIADALQATRNANEQPPLPGSTASPTRKGV